MELCARKQTVPETEHTPPGIFPICQLPVGQLNGESHHWGLFGVVNSIRMPEAYRQFTLFKTDLWEDLLSEPLTSALIAWDDHTVAVFVVVVQDLRGPGFDLVRGELQN